MPHLIVYEPGQAPVAITLSTALGAGRDSQSDLPLIHHQVSRNHARFEPDGDGWFVRDLGSANGTFVNGVRIDGTRLKHGDTLDIGPVKLVFQDQDATEIVLTQPPPDETTLHLAPPNKRLALLYEMTRAIGAVDDLDMLLDRMLESVLKLVGGERAMVVLVDAARREMLRRVVCAAGKTAKDLVVARAMTMAMLERREGVIVRNAYEMPNADTLSRQGIASAMGAPLDMSGRILGFLYVDDRTQAQRFGADDLDFLCALARLAAVAIDNADRLSRVTDLAQSASRLGPVQEIIGNCPSIQKVRTLVLKCAAAPTASVLIRGESGTGKELVARALHAASSRARRPFVAINCAAIPDTMIEGVLFGHEKGAFTGAAQRRRGQFALADQGTLFLDEVGDLSLPAQAKVLRMLQDGEILPLGAEMPVRVDVRVISATHKDLLREMAEGRFREDLFYRLNVLEIEVPPLRDRGADIELLARTFLEAAALNLEKRIQGFTPAALTAIRSHCWPGNVRQLRNEVERALILAEETWIDVTDFGPSITRTSASSDRLRRGDTLAERYSGLETSERALVEEALTQANGNLAEAARLLGITRIMMRRRVDRFGLRGHDE